MFEHKDHVKKYLRYTNSRYRNTQFTCKEESNDKISFLDISIIRSKKITYLPCYTERKHLVVFT